MKNNFHFEKCSTDEMRKVAETGCWDLATVTRYLVLQKIKKGKLLCMTLACHSNVYLVSTLWTGGNA
jgi:hypothetical protein